MKDAILLSVAVADRKGVQVPTDNQNLHEESLAKFQVSYKPGYYVVCLLDLLGQKSLLNNWPNPLDGSQPVVPVIRQSVEPLLKLDEIFLESYSKLCDSSLEGLPQASATDVEYCRRIKGSSVKTQQFGDTFVFYAELSSEYGDFNPSPLMYMLKVSSMSMLWLLAGDPPIPMRGAITIDRAVALPNGRFYGPALAVAHAMEQQEACSPRVLVSDAVRSFLSDEEPLSRNGCIGEIFRERQIRCKDLLIQDSDGKWMLDFAGASARNKLGMPPDKFDEARRRAIERVRALLDHYIKTGDAKLAGRYALLHDYLLRSKID